MCSQLPTEVWLETFLRQITGAVRKDDIEIINTCIGDISEQRVKISSSCRACAGMPGRGGITGMADLSHETSAGDITK